MWGFPDTTTKRSRKYQMNWKPLIRRYNKISKGDVVLLQCVRDYTIHGLAVVEDKFYDDETPVWDEELKRKEVLYPWKVAFSLMLFSERPIATLAILGHDHITGYGLGTIKRADVDIITEYLKDNIGLKIKL